MPRSAVFMLSVILHGAHSLQAQTASHLRPRILNVRTQPPIMSTPQKLEMVDDETFEEAVVAASATQPVIVDWFEEWCGPCKLVEPLLAELHAAGSVKVLKAKPASTAEFRAWLEKQSKRYKIHGLPMCIAFVNGKPMSTTLMGRFSAVQLDALAKSAVHAVRGAAASPTRVVASPIMLEQDEEDAADAWEDLAL